MTSRIGALEAALLAVASANMTPVTTQAGPIAHDDIPAGDFPFAYTQGFAISPSIGDAGTTVETITGELVIVTSGMGHEELLVRADAVRAAILAEPTLGGLVSAETLVGLETVEVGIKARRSATLSIEARSVDTTSASEDVISYAIVTTVDLLAGSPTVGTYLGTVVPAIIAALGGAATRDIHDIGDPAPVSGGMTTFQLSSFSVSIIQDSNVTNTRVSMQLRVHHGLASGETERSYTEGTTAPGMLAVTPGIMARSFWVAGFSTVKVVDLPELSFPSDLTRA